MVSLLIALVVTCLIGYLIVNKYKSQFVLFMGGIILMVLAIILDGRPLLAAKQSTGLVWFDIFKFIERTFSRVT